MKKLNTIKSIAVLSAALIVLSGIAGCAGTAAEGGAEASQVEASQAEAEPTETLCRVIPAVLCRLRFLGRRCME